MEAVPGSMVVRKREVSVTFPMLYRVEMWKGRLLLVKKDRKASAAYTRLVPSQPMS